MIEAVHSLGRRLITIDTLGCTHQDFSLGCFEHTTDFFPLPVAINHLFIIQHYLIHARMIIAHSLIIESYPYGIILPVAIDALNAITYSVA